MVAEDLDAYSKVELLNVAYTILQLHAATRFNIWKIPNQMRLIIMNLLSIAVNQSLEYGQTEAKQSNSLRKAMVYGAKTA